MMDDSLERISVATVEALSPHVFRYVDMFPIEWSAWFLFLTSFAVGANDQR